MNQRVLRVALEEAGIPFKDGEIENTYRLLTDDDVNSGTQVQTRNELDRDGVPIDRVESDFVSHQTVYNHLIDCLDASLEMPSDEEQLERSSEKLGALQNRIEAVTTDTVAQLERNEVADIGDFDVTICHRDLQRLPPGVHRPRVTRRPGLRLPRGTGCQRMIARTGHLTIRIIHEDKAKISTWLSTIYNV